MTSLVLVVGLGCGPSVPADVPATSAASDRAAAAPAVSLATALRGDPPLPGEPSGAWVGLGEPSAAGMGQHHHMEGMNMDMPMGAADGGHDAH